MISPATRVGLGFPVIDFSKSRKQMLIIEGIRLGFLSLILSITVILQAAQPDFVNLEILLPIYATLFTALSVHTIYIYFFDGSLRYWPLKAFIFAFDTTVVTLLIYYTGVSHSIFLFLYLVNIILCGLVFQKAGAIILASWTSILFSGLLVLAPNLSGQALYFALGLNNMAFFTVAFLSGYLSEQINFMGSALNEQSRGMRALQDMHRSIVENVGSGMMTTTENGEILHCNPEGLRIIGLDLSDVEGESAQGIFPTIMKTLETRPPRRGQTVRRDIELKNAYGDQLTIEVVVSPVWKAQAQGADSLNGFVFLFQDLTKIRKMEFAMRQSEKLAAVGQLAAGIAHEIRNPLASISGSIQLMESMDGTVDEKRRLMNIVLREIDRLNGMISEFLDFVRPDQIKKEEINLRSLLIETLDMLKVNDRLRQDVEQIRLVEEQEVICYGEYGKLKQAILNILINAYQALEKSESPQVSVSLKNGEKGPVLSIADNGCGMDEPTRKKIFEPFHTTKPKGTGLGLAITHKIFQSHSADVFVKSEIGVGTEFVIEFTIDERNQKKEQGEPQTSSVDSPLELKSEKLENKQVQQRGSG